MAENRAKNDTITSPFDLNNHNGFEAWKSKKLCGYPVDSSDLVVDIFDLAHPLDGEIEKIHRLLSKTNMVVYRVGNPGEDLPATKKAIRSFTDRLGLDFSETHRSAEEESLVALEVSGTTTKRGFIPYTNRPMNWHTDGYYNSAAKQIGSFILHCTRNATAGGVNQLFDPEIAYIRLRDENPAYIEALSHPEAMTIPFNREADGSVRPNSIGPVFRINDSGGLSMRYTARTRSISWRDDTMTREAVSFLGHLLNSEEPHIFQVKLESGQGIINNNVLHNRTGFEINEKPDQGRLILRVRFYQRVQ